MRALAALLVAVAAAAPRAAAPSEQRFGAEGAPAPELLPSSAASAVLAAALVTVATDKEQAAARTSDAATPVFVVAPGGSDDGRGTADEPFATPERGVAALTAACTPVCAGGAELVLRGGVYRSPAGAKASSSSADGTRPWLELSGASAGPGAWIRIRGEDGEDVALLGSRPVVFEPAGVPTDDPVWAHLGSGARAHVLRANVSQWVRPRSGGAGGGGVDPSTGEPLPSPELMWGGRVMPEARWPDDPVAPGARRHACGEASASVDRDEPLACQGWARVSPDQKWRWDGINTSSSADVLHWSYWRKQAPRNATLRFRGFFAYDWVLATQQVEDIFPDNASVRFAQPWYSMGFWGGSRYYATGAPEALASPGEWFLDAPRGFLYALPPSDADGYPGGWCCGGTGTGGGGGARSAAAGFGPELTDAVELLRVSESHRVWVSGLRLSGSRGTLAVVANCTDVRVEGLRLWGSGAAAVNAHYDRNRRVTIANNSVLDTATFSVWLAGGNRTDLSPSGSVVEGNVIERYGRTSLVFSPAISVDGTGHLVIRNNVTTGPNCAIMWSGNDVAMLNNYLHDSVRDTLDAGAFCTGPRDWTVTNWTLSGNAVVGVGATNLPANIATDPRVTGVYFDRVEFGGVVKSNVFVMPHPPPVALKASQPQQPRAVYQLGGRNATVTDNLFVVNVSFENNPVGLLNDKDQQTNNSRYYQELREHRWRDPPVSVRYPDVAKLDDFYSADCASRVSCPPAPWNNTVARNIALNASVFFVPLPARANFSDDRFGLVGNLVNVDPAEVFARGADAVAELSLAFAPGGAAERGGIAPFPSTFGAQWTVAQRRALLWCGQGAPSR